MGFCSQASWLACTAHGNAPLALTLLAGAWPAASLRHPELNRKISINTTVSMSSSLQITAGSLLPLKAPVMRGTVLDVMACRGRLEVGSACRLLLLTDWLQRCV